MPWLAAHEVLGAGSLPHVVGRDPSGLRSRVKGVAQRRAVADRFGL